jgi:hypothetical protein
MWCDELWQMEWSQARTQGTVPSPHAGHAGATIGNSFYVIGGGDNKSGISDTLVLNMDTLVWSLVASVKGQTAISSEVSIVSLMLGIPCSFEVLFQLACKARANWEQLHLPQ